MDKLGVGIAVGWAAWLLLAGAAVAAENLALPAAQAAWTEADKAAQRQAGTEIIAQLMAANAARKSEFTIPPGDYRFTSQSGFSILTLRGLENIHILAQGATFWFDVWKFGLHVTECKNVIFEGLTLEYDPLPYSQGTIVGLHEDAEHWKSYLDYEVDPGFPTPDEIKHQAALDRDPASMPTVVFDEKGERIKLNQWGKPALIEKISDRVYRIGLVPPSFPYPDPQVYTSYSDYGVKVGDRFALLHRLADSVVLTSGSQNVQYLDVNLYSSPGLAFVESGNFTAVGANVYRRCKLIRRPDTARLLGPNCDGFHSAYTRVGPIIEDCEAGYIGDDFINIRGAVSAVVRVEAENVLDIATRHGFEGPWILQSGMPIHVLSFDTGEIRSSAIITGVEPCTDEAALAAAKAAKKALNVHIWGGDKVFRVTLDQPVKAGANDYIIYGACNGEGFVIRNNHFYRNLAGIRIQSANGIFENNRIEYSKGGITIRSHFNWLEGAICHDIDVRGNTLVYDEVKGCGKSAPFAKGVAAIYVQAEPRLKYPGELPARLHHDIRFENNTIIRPPAAAFMVGNAYNVTIQGNKIIQPAYQMFDRMGEEIGVNGNYGIIVCASADKDSVRIENNEFVDKPAGFPGEIFIADAPATKDAPAQK